jgi:protein involved in polysaccharide export with SLBB domain
MSLMLIILALISISPAFSANQDILANDFAIYSDRLSQSFSYEEPIDYSSASFVEQLGINLDLLDIDSDIQIARALSNSDYPITPGDVYVISYKVSDELINYSIKVNGDYTFKIPGFDSINTKGYTLAKLKKQVEDLIQQYYAFSNPQFSLYTVGNFTVTLKGEVTSTVEVSAWGLSRLSDVVAPATKYASSRSIEIQSKDGSINTYDLFAALKLGDLTQNPLLKSGDIITFKKAKRIVTLSGDVYKPGVYQLLDGDNLDTLLYTYAGGLLKSGDSENISVSRFEEDRSYKQIILDGKDTIALENEDVITVPSYKRIYNSLSVVGAISSTDNSNSNLRTNIIGMSSGKIIYYFAEGERLSSLVEKISSRFNSSSDLNNSYILRGDKRINVNLQLLLNGDLSQDQIIMPSDTLLIPFDQKFVNVQGAVDRSSSYAYAPDKTVDYYIALAGGLTEYATGSIKIYDKDGNKLDKNSLVPSESTIVVDKSDFQRNFATTVAVVGLVSTTVTIIYNLVQIYNNTN